MPAKSVELQGVVPVLPTPFRADESIDADALRSCVKFAQDCRLPAVCLPAYAGEFYKLTESERLEVVGVAVDAAAGQIGVVAQSNHPAARGAADLARQNEERGADLISFAIPRLFSLGPEDVLDYCRTVCRAVSLPVLIQDFNPGGSTVGADFAVRLADECDNFRYLKLEEPLMSEKVVAIREATQDRIGVLEGWGGMYMLDLMPAGICGLIPGLGAADILQRIWELAKAGELESALDLFERVLPQLVFSLQNMELFLCLEKQLLAARGILPEGSTAVRRPTLTPDDASLEYGLLLNRRLISAAGQL